MNFLPAARPPLMPKETIDPAPRGSGRFGELMVRMILQRGMQHPVDRLVGGERLEHRERVAHVALHANAQRLDALQQLERIGRRQTGAEIAQTLRCARA